MALSDSPTGFPFFRALRQKAFQVVVRDPGQRFLSAPRPIGPEAARHWQFAWLSVAAYGKTPAARHRIRQSRASSPPTAQHSIEPDPEAEAQRILSEAGWTRWPEFFSAEVKEKIDESHLRVEVWECRVSQEDRARSCVAVTFGGTIFDNEKDWRSNLRWFLPGRSDEYSQVVQTFGPAFIQEYLRKAATDEGAHLRDAEMFSTGHSLGGGLAQQFAYALPLEPKVPRVHRVFAFDPSPVTGFFSLPVELRNKNKYDLIIDRIYERHEILAIVRSITSLFYKPSAQHPTIRGIRYSLLSGWNPIADHSIVNLAKKLISARD